MLSEYEFADLTRHEQLLRELTALESRMSETVGYPVSLIAYTRASDKGDAWHNTADASDFTSY